MAGHSKRLLALPWVLVAFLTGTVVWLGSWQMQTLDLLEKARSESAETSEKDANVSAEDSQIKAAARDSANAALVKTVIRNQADDPRALGSVDAPNVILEWADYRCPFCAKWALETLAELQPAIDSGQLRVEFHDMVLFGDESTLAHQAARAAGNQGKYWEYANAIWGIHTGSGHPDFSADKAVELAKQVGISDLQKFKTDMNSDEIKAGIKKETEAATTLGITGTPFFFVNTTAVPGALPTSDFWDLLTQYGVEK